MFRGGRGVAGTVHVWVRGILRHVYWSLFSAFTCKRNMVTYFCGISSGEEATHTSFIIPIAHTPPHLHPFPTPLFHTLPHTASPHPFPTPLFHTLPHTPFPTPPGSPSSYILLEIRLCPKYIKHTSTKNLLLSAPWSGVNFCVMMLNSVCDCCPF